MKYETVHYLLTNIDSLPLDESGLYPVQYERHGSFLLQERKNDYCRIYNAINKISCSLLGCSREELIFRTTDLGKPYFQGNPLYFSLAHSGRMVCMAFSKNPLGVDLELRRLVKHENTLLRRVFSKDDMVLALEMDFFDVWTRGEAYVKCVGQSVFSLRDKSILQSNPFTVDHQDYFYQYVGDEKVQACFVHCGPFRIKKLGMH